MNKFKSILILTMMLFISHSAYCYTDFNINKIYIKTITPISVTGGITRSDFDKYWILTGKRMEIITDSAQINNFLSMFDNLSLVRELKHGSDMDVQTLKMAGPYNFWENTFSSNIDTQIILSSDHKTSVIWIADKEMFIGNKVYNVNDKINRYLKHKRDDFYSKFKRASDTIIINYQQESIIGVSFEKDVQLNHLGQIMHLPRLKENYFLNEYEGLKKDFIRGLYSDDKAYAGAFFRIGDNALGYVYEIISTGVNMTNNIRRVYLSICNSSDEIIETTLIALDEKEQYYINAQIIGNKLSLSSVNYDKVYEITPNGLIELTPNKHIN